MTTLLMLAAIWISMMLAYALILSVLARRSSSTQPTILLSFAVGVLCVLLNLAVLWLLNPFTPDLAPIAIIVRELLIFAIGVLGSVRIIQFILRTTYGHAWYLWGLSTAIFAAVAIGFAFFVLKPYVAEAWMIPTNGMAPTLVGWHRDDICPECGGPRVMPAGEANTQDAKFQDQDPDPIGICAKCRKITHYGKAPGTLQEIPLLTADRILVNKLLKPQRWDMIVFEALDRGGQLQPPNQPKVQYVKRLVGLPGETVYLKDGGLWINDARVEPPPELTGLEYDPKIRGDVMRFGSPENPWKLGPDECVVLGDFRERSADSRVWGPLLVKNIEAVVALTYWPPARWKIHR